MPKSAASFGSEKAEDVEHIGRIPVRNIWLLMLYASDLFRHIDRHKRVSVEENPDDIPDLVAEILAREVSLRLKRNMSLGYKPRKAVLRRVRGRIDLLSTERHRLLERGMIACRFNEMTVNTPRNRFVRAALEQIARIRTLRKDLARRCRVLALKLKKMGVTGEKPGRGEVSVNRFGRHDMEDQKMVHAAHLAFNLGLPTESAGTKLLVLPEREVSWIRKLYEKGVAGFYGTVLSEKGWTVEAGIFIKWLPERKTSGIDRILPSMQTDIVLDHRDKKRRIIIDTKFNSIITRGWYRDETMRSAYMYQIYAYLKSQKGRGDHLADKAEGLLLHPSVGDMVNETVIIQGHQIRFATVDLSANTKEIRRQLLDVVLKPADFSRAAMSPSLTRFAVL